MISRLKKATILLRLISFAKIPLLFYCRPKIVHIDDSSIQIMIKLNRKTKNHINSMYLGALVIGADIASGYLALEKTRLLKDKISLVFKDMSSNFIKRADTNVIFSCGMGKEIDSMIEETVLTGERINRAIQVTAYSENNKDNIFATFSLTLSLKKIVPRVGLEPTRP